MNKHFYIARQHNICLIAPEKRYILILKKSINIINEVDNKLLRKASNRLDTIFVTRRSGFTNELFMPEKIWFTNKSAVAEDLVKDLSSGIVHESVHVTQFKEGKYIYSRTEMERQAISIQKQFQRKIGIDSTYLDIALDEKYWTKQSDEKSFTHFRNLLWFMKNNKLILKFIS